MPAVPHLVSVSSADVEAAAGCAGEGAVVRSRHSGRPLRAWQSEAVGRWFALGCPQDFLAEATPGAGKTVFAFHLLSSSDLKVRDGSPLTISVLCPTAHLRKQWQVAAHSFGVDLCTELTRDHLDLSFHGAVLTYQQVLTNPERYRRSLGRGWAILDECHHAGEGKSWADALMHAFGDAQHRLSLSGTAFRSDACRIPFIRYSEDDVSVADYRYGYGDALRDRVVRPVYFITFGGEASWFKDGRTRSAAFGEVVSREDSAARLRTVLDPAGGWMQAALRRADQRLAALRRGGHPNAGGLVVCIDQAHARQVAERLRITTGSTPAVALSDDPESSLVITRFAIGISPWIVAVRQVSEGTDIPRLRVGVWATNATTELFFRQWVGRFVRVVGGIPDQDAFLYLPADPVLLRHARALAAERAHHLPARAPSDDDVRRERTSIVVESDYHAIGSTAVESKIIFGSHVVERAELERAHAVALDLGLELEDPLAFALALRHEVGPGAACEIPLEAKRRALRSLLSRHVREYCARTGAAHRDAYARLKRRAGRPVSRLNEVMLIRHVRTVEGWLAVERQPHTGLDHVPPQKDVMARVVPGEKPAAEVPRLVGAQQGQERRAK
jgi:superfamily II DNA or RNA helicase